MEDVNRAIAPALIEHMRRHFEEYVGFADSLESPNVEDTTAIKCAIVGFSLIAEDGKWTQDEYEFVRGRLEDTPQQLDEDAVRLKAMCLGALCAMRLEGKADDREFAVADAQLPGLLLALES